MAILFVAALLTIVCLSGAAVVGFTVYKIAKEKTDTVWEYLIAILLGAGLLVWPAVKGVSLVEDARETGTAIEVEDFDGFRIRHQDTGEELSIERDPTSGGYELRQTQPPRQAPRERRPPTSGESGTDAPENGTQTSEPEEGTAPATAATAASSG